MSEMRITLNEQQQIDLRKKGLLEEGEFAFLAGDLIVAENPVSNSRRVVGDTKLLSEGTNKRVLRG
jgi:hypothetical protein